MKMKFIILVCINLLFTENYGHDVKGFDDSLIFNINWPGPKSSDKIDLTGESIIVTSSHQEKYQCYLPNIQDKENNTEEKYEGPTALDLIAPLFNTKSPCSYRLETYWTYEVCHGRYIRQYHEDREGKTVKLQEYTLGRWDKILQEKMAIELMEFDSVNYSKNIAVPTKKVDGNNLPFFEITMGNGTSCDLNQNKPRQTSVIYVCYVHGKHEVYSLKETSTCQYEIIVLSPLLCAHPKYKPFESGENEIHCLPLDESPNKPHNLLKMKQDSLKLRRSADIDHIRVEFLPLDLNEKEETKALETPVDTSPVESFLSGKNCLVGGTGWWKYEFCYGKSVEQYHVEKDGSKTAIKLGVFEKEKHLEWIASHPHKRPKPVQQRTQLSHLYSGGSVCDKTGKPRQTEVKLKCLENAASVNAVSLYLLEPRYCEYILGVESPLICDILSRADENGLVESREIDETPVDESVSINVIKV